MQDAEKPNLNPVSHNPISCVAFAKVGQNSLATFYICMAAVLI